MAGPNFFGHTQLVFDLVQLLFVIDTGLEAICPDVLDPFAATLAGAALPYAYRGRLRRELRQLSPDLATGSCQCDHSGQSREEGAPFDHLYVTHQRLTP